VIAYGECVPIGAPVAGGFALGTVAARGLEGDGCCAAHPCTIAIAAAIAANIRGRLIQRWLN